MKQELIAIGIFLAVVFAWIGLSMLFTGVIPVIKKIKNAEPPRPKLTLAQAYQEMMAVIDQAQTYEAMNCLVALRTEFRKSQRHKLSKEDMEYWLGRVEEAQRERIREIVREGNIENFRLNKKYQSSLS